MEGLRRGILEIEGPYMKLIVLVNPLESMECQEFCLPIKKAPPIAGGAWKQVDESSQLHALVFHGFRQGGAHLGRGLGDHDARFAQGFLLGGGSAFASGHDGARVAHAASLGSRGSGDERGHGLLAVVLDPFGGFLFLGTADFTDHDEGVRIGVFREELNGLLLGHAVDGVAADADAHALAQAHVGDLPHGFISERAGTGDDADSAGLEDVGRHDADLAAGGGVDDAGAVRADEGYVLVFQEYLHFLHVLHRDAFRDADDEFDARVRGFHDGVGREGRRDEDHGGVAVRGLFGFRHGVEYGDLAFKELAALAGGHAGNHVGAEVHAVFGMECAGATGDALHDETGVFVNERCHCRNKW